MSTKCYTLCDNYKVTVRVMLLSGSDLSLRGESNSSQSPCCRRPSSRFCSLRSCRRNADSSLNTSCRSPENTHIVLRIGIGSENTNRCRLSFNYKIISQMNRYVNGPETAEQLVPPVETFKHCPRVRLNQTLRHCRFSGINLSFFAEMTFWFYI